jgi:hypothetical protein
VIVNVKNCLASDLAKSKTEEKMKDTIFAVLCVAPLPFIYFVVKQTDLFARTKSPRSLALAIGSCLLSIWFFVLCGLTIAYVFR